MVKNMSQIVPTTRAKAFIDGIAASMKSFPDIPIAKELQQIQLKITELNNKNALDGNELSHMSVIVSKLADGAQGPEQRDKIQEVARKMNEAAKELLGIVEEPVQKPKPPVSQRIEEHNQKAWAALPKGPAIFRNYPFSRKEKEIAKTLRVDVPSANSFSNEPDKIEIFSQTKALSSSYVHLACAQGKRPYMEDRSMAVTFTFRANGNTYSADLFGIFDGHGGFAVADFAKDLIPFWLVRKLEAQLRSKDLNDEDIFLALKEAIAGFHKVCIKNNFSCGTTAIVSLKLAGVNELWTACVGDSSAYLNRKGTIIPMSIEQKPSFVADKAGIVKPNEYGRQLLNRGVELRLKADPKVDNAVLKREKMVMSFVGPGNDQEMRLGLPDEFKCHLDMARSIGDIFFDKWKKFTPEIFKQQLQPSDQLILHSDGVKAPSIAVVKAVEWDRNLGTSIDETLKNIVQFSIPYCDNISAMIVTFDKSIKSPKDSFLWDLVNGGTSDQLKSSFLQLEKTDNSFFTHLCANATSQYHEEWENGEVQGPEPEGNELGKQLMLKLLNTPITAQGFILNIASFKRKRK